MSLFGFARNRPQVESRRERMITSVAAASHHAWREQYYAEHGQTPRWKTTTDRDWINKHRTDEVNIASASYDSLPSDWQKESRASAEVAVDQVLSVAVRSGLDEAFIERASAVVHEQWIERNKGHAPAEQLLPYAELTEEEKEKDRFFVRAAIDVLDA